MQWFDAALMPEKLRAIFYYLNNGEPIDATMLGRLLKHIYRETKEVETTANLRQASETRLDFHSGGNPSRVSSMHATIGCQ